jgi:hypothetical protein
MNDCGGVIDDYAVDPLHRNELSFIFLLHFDYLKGCKDISNNNNLWTIKE